MFTVQRPAYYGVFVYDYNPHPEFVVEVDHGGCCCKHGKWKGGGGGKHGKWK